MSKQDTRSRDRHPDWLSRQLERADWPNRQFSHLVRAGGLEWHVQRFGNLDAPVCLLVHGTGASCHSYAGLVAQLASKWQVVVPDLPGHGFTRHTSTAQLTLPGMAKALAALLSEMNTPPSIVAGHSAGTAILLQMALDGHLRDVPVTGLNSALQQISGNSFLSPLAKMLFANPLTPRLFSLQARFGGVTERLLKATGSTIDAQSQACYAQLLNTPRHVRGALGMMAGWELRPLVTRLNEIGQPVTLIAAMDDPMVPARVSEAAVRALSQGKFIPVPSGGHLLHEENPAAIAKLMQEPEKAAA
ncbi:alpha/beta fold hydrolase BchO [Roseibium sp. RKSG952]|uniref:alpha/beta fold hydrolase BchO n=1 Tax=Roseibium sp. RKSG952 TaxID=2529384 RepID=UPI0012BD2DA1|nr:alpha/beta fold hydrolase BchO [Roseibium sp. RKSG952]MTH98768.1 alpha/beta fold hydrolase [Roseibium sp. RKSG952]